MRNIIYSAFALILIALCPAVSFADNAQENQDLQRAINELEAAKVYVQQAKELSPVNNRVIFHYDWLLSDLGKIEGGIEEKFNRPRIQPREIDPLKGDYLTVIGAGK